jgi:hypothetical protein
MLVGLTLFSNSSSVSILICDHRYGPPLFDQSWQEIRCQHRISQVIENGLRKPFPIHQR